ncbi:hypothetical protein BDR06DRAFT_359902 [Suillus hirtellus]|nr:hypothetical protein BDR06DRAFT_359902 [Suillus hirtellus]
MKGSAHINLCHDHSSGPIRTPEFFNASIKASSPPTVCPYILGVSIRDNPSRFFTLTTMYFSFLAVIVTLTAACTAVSAQCTQSNQPCQVSAECCRGMKCLPPPASVHNGKSLCGLPIMK